MKKHYIKLIEFTHGAGAECFSICQQLHIKRKGPEKKSILALFIFISSLAGQMQFHSFEKT